MAGRTWEELNAEAQKSLATSTDSSADQSATSDLSVSDPLTIQGGDDDGGDGLEWLELWGIERSSVPDWLLAWEARNNAAKKKIRKVVKQEWVYMGDREASISEYGQGEHLVMPKESRLPPPGPPVLDKTGRIFDVGTYLTESSVFTFVLMESFLKYSDPTLALARTGTGDVAGDETVGAAAAGGVAKGYTVEEGVVHDR